MTPIYITPHLSTEHWLEHVSATGCS